MEPLIRHVRFFNGQFLKEEEFREEQAYGIHMRRRVNYALFEDGVVQIAAADLTVEPESPGDPSDKRIRVRRGMAVGANHDVFQSREIILREDSAVIDLAATFSPSDTIWVTVNYRETPSEPVSLGATSEDSRVDETAELGFHTTNPAGSLTPDGDPIIVLGAVDFDSMAVSTADRQVARLRAALIAAPPSISISPDTVTAGDTVTFDITSAGGLDLSGLGPANVSFNIPDDIDLPGLSVTPNSATSATITFGLDATAAGGPRILTITVGSASASATFMVDEFVPPPIIATFNPTPAVRNQQLIINGSNFVAPVAVSMTGSGPVSPLTVSPASDAITLTVPGTAASGPVTVTAKGGSASQVVGVIG